MTTIPVQVADELLALLDKRAARLGRTRSDLITEALETYVRDDRAAEIDRQIVEGYIRMPDDEWDYTETAKQLIAEEPW